MNRHLPIYLLLVISIMSCSKGYYPDTDEQIYAAITDDDLTIDVTYIGAVPEYHIFELYVENHTDKSLTIEREDIQLLIPSKDKLISPWTDEELIYTLEEEQKKLKKKKKTLAILGALSVAVDVLAVSTGGGAAAEVIYYGAESTAYIVDEQRFMKRAINSIDDEKLYIKEQNLKTVTIPPGQSAVQDVLFPIIPKRTKDDVEFIYRGPKSDYTLIFESRYMRAP